MVGPCAVTCLNLPWYEAQSLMPNCPRGLTNSRSSPQFGRAHLPTSGGVVVVADDQLRVSRLTLGLHVSWIFVSLSWARAAPNPGTPFVNLQRYVPVPGHDCSGPPPMVSRCAVTC